MDRHCATIVAVTDTVGTDQDLLERQDDLQAQAAAVDADLGLTEQLRRLGDPVPVGCAALGLMVRPDLDITVVCERLSTEPVTALGARLGLHPRVRKVLFRNDTGDWNVDPAYPDGLYLGVDYRSAAGTTWNLDIWFVDEPARQPDLAHLRSLPPRLDPDSRLAIITIKNAWVPRQEYGRTVSGADIYTAVLDAGVRTDAEFAAWVAAGKK